jgi:MFS family permease
MLTGNLMLIVATYAIQGFGGSLFQSPNNTELMGALPPRQRGIASSLSATFRNLGMSLGVSIASILVALQLSAAGYYGAILEADDALLAGVVSNVIFASVALCVAGAVVSLMRNGSRMENSPPAPPDQQGGPIHR